MKRILFICFVLMLCLCMSISCLAQDVGEGKTDIKGYIQERIVPVVVGVLTSLIALGTMLFKITSTLKSLKSTRDTFEGEARLRAELARELKAEAQKLQEAVKDVPELKACVEGLAQECRLNSEILSLGFSANGEIIKSGTIIDADPSMELIGNLFFVNSPLHDGALVIRGGRLYAAGCFLPLSDSQLLDKSLGTRHRAAVGMSENSDALVIVVSEETGIISTAQNGVLKRNYTLEQLNELLRSELLDEHATVPEKKSGIWRNKK